MLVHVPNLLSPEQIAQMREVLGAADWADGRITAGAQSAQSKQNLQVPENSPAHRALGEIILTALGRNELFTSAALPLRVFPPLFNRYDIGMRFGTHIDNAIRFAKAGSSAVRVRTDLSATLFLTDPAAYDGGKLVIEDTFGSQSIKLPAGDMILYPASSRHHVTEVTRGSRWASFFWIQSMVRADDARRHLFELDTAIQSLRTAQGDTPEVVRLTGLYHNLVRHWADA